MMQRLNRIYISVKLKSNENPVYRAMVVSVYIDYEKNNKRVVGAFKKIPQLK